MTFFEIITAMAFAAFADAPVDVAVIEVGLGGTWDATNVADADVAVVTPIDLDHTHLLGETIAEIATEKAGIIKPGAHAVLAGQTGRGGPGAAGALHRGRRAGRSAKGIDFGVIDRQLAVGGQLLRLNGAEGPVDDVFLPLLRRPPGGERRPGARRGRGVPRAEGAGSPTWSARASPRCSSPAGSSSSGARRRSSWTPRTTRTARAAAAQAITEAFAFTPLIGVIAVMADKDADGLLRDVRRGA